jgi:hypothetical protein
MILSRRWRRLINDRISLDHAGVDSFIFIQNRHIDITLDTNMETVKKVTTRAILIAKTLDILQEESSAALKPFVLVTATGHVQASDHLFASCTEIDRE